MKNKHLFGLFKFLFNFCKDSMSKLVLKGDLTSVFSPNLSELAPKLVQRTKTGNNPVKLKCENRQIYIENSIFSLRNTLVKCQFSKLKITRENFAYSLR